eukprot:XP_014071381.1 PREDICTED: acyl-coenzyme A thioesterase 11-like isoform X1 [Salmo salar]
MGRDGGGVWCADFSVCDRIVCISFQFGMGKDATRRLSLGKKIRLDRKYIISCKQTEVPLSVPWDISNQISYYNQATPGVLHYISNDIAGLSSSFYDTFHSYSKYREENRDSLATLPPFDL